MLQANETQFLYSMLSAFRVNLSNRFYTSIVIFFIYVWPGSGELQTQKL